MALLETGGKRFTIPVGDVVLGGDASCTIALEGGGLLPRHAILQGLSDGQVVIRKAVPQADVRINGVRLGAEPTPLLHGDKVEIGTHELTFVDERRSGSTQYMQAAKLPDPAVREKASPPAPEGQPTANTGGRVVCLTDGREYQVTGASLVFGRDAGCDVVVPGKDVSRRHGEIIQTPKGYVLVDSSTNGTFVNEQRITSQRVLVRADIIRIGDDQFRFYADPAPPPAPPARPAPSARSDPPAAGAARLKDTVHGVPGLSVPAAPAAAPVPDSRAGGGGGVLLASFLVKTGDLKGQRLSVRTPVVNIGRADYNDLVLPEPSVSTAHAKLQRREGVWVLQDLDSTNGSFVDGEQVKGEAPLAPGAVVRIGDVQLVFEPMDDALVIVKSGATSVMEQLPMPPARPPAPRPAPATPPEAAPQPVRPPPPPLPPSPPPAPRAAPQPARKAPPRKGGGGSEEARGRAGARAQEG